MYELTKAADNEGS